MHKFQIKKPDTGVWLLGALGDVATTLIAGTLAIRKDLASNSGMVTCLPLMNALDLVSLDNLVFGGLDIRPGTLPQAAEEIYRRSGTISRETLDQIGPDLSAINEHIMFDPMTAWNPNAPAADLPALTEILKRMRSQLATFRERHQLDHIVVVNLVSAEPMPRDSAGHDTLAELEKLIASDRKDLVTPSMCGAYAAFMENCPYINFTPNNKSTCGALRELAEQKRLPYYGNDGKTGETLVKTALAPMFAYRNLKVMSWEGVNMLGNGDGATLNNPENRAAKLRNKEDVLPGILGYPLHSGVSINYVPSLGDWKTAWDLIHFQGFLDVKMTMQFTWQGSDSILAAPLVLDMIRLSEFAARHDEIGPMRHLCCFFKNPIDVEEMAFYPQFSMLLDYADRHLRRRSSSHGKNSSLA